MMPNPLRIAAGLWTLLLPHRRCHHAWDVNHCTPPACVLCGATQNGRHR